MSLQDVKLPKKYKNSKILFEQNLDAWRQTTEQAFNTMNLNLTQLRKDCFLATYDYANNGVAQIPTSLQEQINLLASGGTPITGTSSDTFTVNTDGNGAVLSTLTLTGTHTYTFPDNSDELVGKAATQTLTNKTLTTPTIASFVNATHNHTNAAGGGQITDAALSAAVGVTKGGTGLAACAQGDLLYGSAANTISLLNKDATATRYLSNTGAGNNPAWAQVDLTNGVTGTLPVTSGGLGVASPTDHAVLLGSGATAVTPLTVGVSGEILIGVSGADPKWLANGAGDAGKVLTSTGVGDPSWTTVVGATSVTNHAVYVGSGGTTPTAVGPGTTGQVLKGVTGADPAFGAVDLTADVGATVLPVANGGTGLSSAFTAGSVVFSNGTTLAQDNSNFFWDDGNNRLGLGTTSPSASLHVYAAGSREPIIESTGSYAGLSFKSDTAGANHGWRIRSNSSGYFDFLKESGADSYYRFNSTTDSNIIERKAHAKGNANGAVTSTVWTSPTVGASTALWYKIQAIFYSDDASQRRFYLRQGVAYRDGAAALVLDPNGAEGGDQTTTLGTGTARLYTVLSGNTWQVEMLGVAGKNTNVACTIEWQEINQP